MRTVGIAGGFRSRSPERVTGAFGFVAV